MSIKMVQSSLCTALRNSVSGCSYKLAVNGGEPQLVCMCKTSLLFTSLAACDHVLCSIFTQTKPIIRLNIKYKIVSSLLL